MANCLSGARSSKVPRDERGLLGVAVAIDDRMVEAGADIGADGFVLGCCGHGSAFLAATWSRAKILRPMDREFNHGVFPPTWAGVMKEIRTGTVIQAAGQLALTGNITYKMVGEREIGCLRRSKGHIQNLYYRLGSGGTDPSSLGPILAGLSLRQCDNRRRKRVIDRCWPGYAHG